MQNLSSVIKLIEMSDRRIMRILRIIFLLVAGSVLVHLALFLEKLCLI